MRPEADIPQKPPELVVDPVGGTEESRRVTRSTTWPAGLIGTELPLHCSLDRAHAKTNDLPQRAPVDDYAATSVDLEWKLSRVCFDNAHRSRYSKVSYAS